MQRTFLHAAIDALLSTPWPNMRLLRSTLSSKPANHIASSPPEPQKIKTQPTYVQFDHSYPIHCFCCISLIGQQLLLSTVGTCRQWDFLTTLRGLNALQSADNKKETSGGNSLVVGLHLMALMTGVIAEKFILHITMTGFHRKKWMEKRSDKGNGK